MSKATDLELYRQHGDDARRLAAATGVEAARQRHLMRADRYDRIIAARISRPEEHGPLSPQALIRIEAQMPLVMQFYQEIKT